MTQMQRAVTKGRLYRQGFGLTSIVGRAAQQFTVPKGRGDVIGFELFVLNNTLADLDDTFISVIMNGTEVIEDAASIEYSTLYSGGGTVNFTPQIMQDSSTFQLILNSDVAGIKVRMELIFDCEHARRKYGMTQQMQGVPYPEMA